jgi:ribosomal-protein-alanine N-acetyltransferase
VNYQIEQASLLDLNALRQLEQECFGEDAWPLLDIIAALTFPGEVRLKAVVDGEMVGFVGGDPHPREGLGWITTIGVKTAFRRLGIGKALLEACEKQMTVPTIRLTVRRTNLEAIEMYRNAGYVEVELWRRYYPSGEDALLLEKKR